MATMQINGVTITGNSISIKNGRIIVDGEDVTDQYDTGNSLKSITTGEIKADNIQIGENNTIGVYARSAKPFNTSEN